MKNLTKTIILSIILIIMGIKVNAQTQYTTLKTYALELQADSISINGLKTIADFIIKQDSQLYRSAINNFTESQIILTDIYDNSKGRGTGAMEASNHSSVIDMYGRIFFTDDFKNQIAREKAVERKKSINWNGQEYKLTSYSKDKFDNLLKQLKSATDVQATHQKTYKDISKMK